MTSERVFGAVLLALSLAGSWIGRDLQAPVSYEPIGPRAFPLLVLALLALCAVALLVGRHAGSAWPPRAVGARIALLFGVLLAYALLFERLGFMLSTALAAIPIARAFGGAWRQALCAGAGLGVGLFILFDKLLDVVLPVGSWLRWLGH